MEQFSHDLTLALEETSRCVGSHSGRWGIRRRTRSTGNLPCAPQPTEDSSSSPAEGPQNSHYQNQQTGGNLNAQNTGLDGQDNSLLSDSDDRQEMRLSLSTRHQFIGPNFESDSLNENFSPARPNTRRKRKFKRMAVEYETTPSTPGNSENPSAPNSTTATSPTCPMPTFTPIVGPMKKRALKQSQENFRANLLFCGKRKRSHRDRYMDYDHKQHSSSVPRHRDIFAPKNSSYLEYKSRSRSFSKPCERILPLTKSIVSKIEKISQDSRTKIGFQFSAHNKGGINRLNSGDKSMNILKSTTQLSGGLLNNQNTAEQTPVGCYFTQQQHISQRIPHKSGSFESTFTFQDIGSAERSGAQDNKTRDASGRKHKHSGRQEMKMQLQFDDPNFMDCGGLNDFLSSSSLSSSDSEAAETNESDREGDDELTDWPGNEAMVNFTSKNDFKRAKQRNKPSLPQIKSDDVGQDDDTLMSGDDANLNQNSRAGSVFSSTPGGGTTPLATSQLQHLNSMHQEHQPLQEKPDIHPPNTLDLIAKYSPALPANLAPTNKPRTNVASSTPIDITPKGVAGVTPIAAVTSIYNQIESEMSGETSNHFLSSPNTTSEIREIRAGCRRIRDERPGFSILTSANEELSKFLQDGCQMQMSIPDIDADDHYKLTRLAKLYSLNMQIDDKGTAILNKTSNTTQSIRMETANLQRRFLSDFKRRCYGDGSGQFLFRPATPPPSMTNNGGNAGESNASAGTTNDGTNIDIIKERNENMAS